MPRSLLLAAVALTLTSGCGGQYTPSEADPVALGLSPGDATLERLELSLDATGAEVELFFAAPAGCPVVPTTFSAQLNGQALVVQDPGHFGWVTRPACEPGSEDTTCEGTILTLGCEAPKASIWVQRGPALVDGALELQVGDARYSYPASLSALAWHVSPATADGSQGLRWGGQVAPTSTKTTVQRAETGTAREALTSSSQAELVLPQLAGARVELVTSVVLTSPGAPKLLVTVRQVLALN